MAAKPVGIVDYLLAAAQGIGNLLALYRTASAGAKESVEEIIWHSFAYGAIAGVVSLWLMALIYGRLGARMGGKSTTTQVIHVLAYGGVPVAASAALWLLTALLAGEATFVETPRADVEGFLVLLLHMQFFAHVLLAVWSIVLQVMGFSEVQGLTVRRALGVWVLGQLIAVLASLFLGQLVETLFPWVPTHFIPQQ